MKTFDEVKKRITQQKYAIVDRFTKILADPNLTIEQINANENVKNIVLDDIENIDIITNMRIGRAINDTIEFVKKYALKDSSYYENFDKFVNNYMLGLAETGDRYIAPAVDELGMTKEDFEECFKGKNINNPGFGDELRQKANRFYGTSIPMEEEYKMLKSTDPRYLKVEIEDENERNKAIMHWFDGIIASGICVDSQILKAPDYQEAKKNLEGRSI